MANKAKNCREGEKFTFSAQIKKLNNKNGGKPLFRSMSHYFAIMFVLAFQNEHIYACRCSTREIMVKILS